MAKSTLQNKVTAEYWHRWGEHYYGSAVDMEDRGEPQSKIDASWKMAAMEFWLTLTLGSEKTPFSLFKCFVQGVEVKQDDNIAALLYWNSLETYTSKLC